MAFQDPQLPPVNPEKTETQPPSLTVRNDLDRLRLERLRENLPKKQGILGMIRGLWDDYGRMDATEKKRVATLLGSTIFGLILATMKDKDEEKPEADKPQSPQKAEADKAESEEEEDETESDEEEGKSEGVEDEEELVSRPKRSKVVCDQADLICINTDPAGSKRPSYMAGKSLYLCEYGLPEYDVFKEEMLYFLAPDETDKDKAMKKVIAALQRSPMGKYQCMPQYLFQYVDAFKKYNFDWKSEGKEEEKLHAMWEFLQSEDLQREACTGYVQSIVSSFKKDPRFNNDPRYIFASYYGGESAGKALLAHDTGTATEAQSKRVSKKQGAYISIEEYAGKSEQGKKLAQFPAVDIEAVVNQIAGKESGNLRNVKTKPRDEVWQQDQRFAYNQTEQTDNETPVA